MLLLLLLLLLFQTAPLFTWDKATEKFVGPEQKQQREQASLRVAQAEEKKQVRGDHHYGAPIALSHVSLDNSNVTIKLETTSNYSEIALLIEVRCEVVC